MIMTDIESILYGGALFVLFSPVIYEAARYAGKLAMKISRDISESNRFCDSFLEDKIDKS